VAATLILQSFMEEQGRGKREQGTGVVEETGNEE
jgi:hypothetical protein